MRGESGETIIGWLSSGEKESGKREWKRVKESGKESENVPFLLTFWGGQGRRKGLG